MGEMVCPCQSTGSRDQQNGEHGFKQRQAQFTRRQARFTRTPSTVLLTGFTSQAGRAAPKPESSSLNLYSHDLHLSFFLSFIMSTRDYPAFYTLNQPEQDISIPVPVDQGINTYPFDQASWHNNLMATIIFDQFLTAAAPYEDLPSFPAEILRTMISLEESSSSTRELTGPVRLKHAHPRVVHACDYCRHRKSKCSGDQPLCTSCKKRGRKCTWTPIKSTKSRTFRKFNVCQPPSTQDKRPYIVAPIPTYPSTWPSVVQNLQVLGTSSIEPLAQTAITSPIPPVDFDRSDLNLPDISLMCISPPPSCRPRPNLCNNWSHTTAVRTHQRPHNFCGASIASSFSSAASATQQYAY